MLRETNIPNPIDNCAPRNTKDWKKVTEPAAKGLEKVRVTWEKRNKHANNKKAN